MPRNVDCAVEIALYFADLDTSSSPQLSHCTVSAAAIATAKDRSTDSEMAQLSDSFEKLLCP